HMIVVQVRPDLSFEVIDREKEMIRLGAGGLDGRALTADAMHAALQVLSKFRRLAESHRVDEVIAVATSATREAENGGEFLRAITQQTDIRPRVISGTEEARLIHTAAVYGVSVPRDVAVVIDIGGGSVEVTRGAGSNVEAGRSFKLGVIRLTERFVNSDPLEPRDERKLVRHIDAEIGAYLDEIAQAGFDRVIGTSGTILSLGAVASAADGLRPGAPLRNRRLNAKQIRRVRKELVALDIERRLRVPGLEPRRVDLAAAGAILLDEILRRLGADEITLCDLSLREGLILDYIARHRKEIAQADRYPDVRRRSVFELAERFDFWSEHSQHVARLALALFDQTRAIHGLTDREREWLEYAAILHDVGVHISYEGHHKHSYYLITNGDLRGFEPDEIQTIALVARYHRQAPPKRKHDAFGSLPRPLRRTVRALAAMLRLAESLDRSHAQAVAGLELHDRGDDDLLQLRTAGDAELELWAAARSLEPFERLTRKPLRLEVGRVPAEAPVAPPQASAAAGDVPAEPADEAARLHSQAPRRRGMRRNGHEHATAHAGDGAERRRPARHRIELVRARDGGDGHAQDETREPDDLEPAPRRGLR
ncbi:MAG TPA: Ppx/GppA phosphatase family protein, partial [Vicinamibacterales bacterium]|nr:Ppx/GppA phosphatase family protein [Vicinamibacterales bacterium]